MKNPTGQTAASFVLLLSLPTGILEAMFCFCFQSPSLKLQALENDLGPPASPVDPQVRDNQPARQEPLFSEGQDLYLTRRLLLHSPSSPAEDPADSSQSGKTMTTKS